MFKSHEVINLIEDGLQLSINKTDEDTIDESYDMEVIEHSATKTIVDFITYRDGEEFRDRYKITAELLE